MTDPRDAILAKLDRLGSLLYARDAAIVDELWSDLGFTLAGSEAGEVATTRADLVRLFDGLFASPARLSWTWDATAVTRQGDVAWLFAEGHVRLTYPDRIEPRPYRLVAILQAVDAGWHWRLFSGSEPTGPTTADPARAQEEA